MPQGFDVNAARQAGYSDDEILQHLTQSRKFDVQGALKAGYSQQEIIDHLASTPATPKGIEPTGTIKAAPSGAAQYLQNVESDIKYGGGTTLPGRILKKLGATGIARGMPSEGEFTASPASPLTGILHAAQGVAEKRPLKVAGGIAEAAQIPSGFMAPAIPKAPEAALAVGEQLNKVPVVGRAFASTTRAGRAFQDVNQAIGKQLFEVTPRLSDAALNVYKEAELGGGNIPQVVRKFVQRVTSPNAQPLTFEEARRFASNASGLSASEWFNMLKNGNMRRLLGEFHGALNDAVQRGAEVGGEGPKFAQAMREYSQAKQNLRAFQAAVGAAAIKYGYGKAHELGALLLGGQ